MDQQLLNSLTDAQKSRFARLERLFKSEGWKDVMAWAALNSEDQKQRQLHAPTWEQNRLAYGAWLAFDMLASLEETTLKEFEALAVQQHEQRLTEDEERHE